MKTSNHFITSISSILFFLVLLSCSHQLAGTKSITKTSAYPNVLENAMKNKRYFIMQSGLNFYTVTSVDMDRRKQQMTVTLDKVDSIRLVNFKNPTPNLNKSAAQPEIHVFMKDSTTYTFDEPHTIPVDKVARIDLVD